MAVERTFSIVKPDAVANNVIGKIYERFESVGLHIIGCKMLRLTRGQAEAFYEIHRERPFYRELVDYMVSGPVVVQVLEGEDAVAMNRQVMGATNPAATSGNSSTAVPSNDSLSTLLRLVISLKRVTRW